MSDYIEHQPVIKIPDDGHTPMLSNKLLLFLTTLVKALGKELLGQWEEPNAKKPHCPYRTFCVMERWGCVGKHFDSQ